MIPCKVCKTPCTDAGRDQRRAYMRCGACGSRYVPPAYWLTPAREKQRYALHDNSLANDGYMRYLGAVADTVERCVEPGARALDYGSGPARALETILRGRGFDAASFDPLYDIGPASLSRRWDIVVICEVIEHVRDIDSMLKRLRPLLHAESVLLIHTRTIDSVNDFMRWWYKEDPTHINFFSRAALRGICESLGLRVVHADHARCIASRTRGAGP
jgi:hypothetical protein